LYFFWEYKLKICPKCRAENVYDDAKFCNECGAPLAAGESDIGESAKDKIKTDDLDFVVTETSGPTAPDFFGEGNRDQQDKASETTERIDEVDSQDLEISTTADLLNDGTFDTPVSPKPEPNEFDFSELASDNSNPPETDPAPPEKKPEIPSVDWNTEVPPDSRELKEMADLNLEAKKSRTTESSTPEPQPEDRQTFKSEPESITAPGTIRPAIDPAKQAEMAKSDKKVRGIAYFRKNLIQIAGNPFMHDGDELIVNNKRYLLRTKKLSRNMTIGLFAGALVIILLIVAAQFINSPLSGDGSIVGMILDENGQPYLEGARVTLQPLNKTTTSNAQGFFRFDMIPTGTYDFVYELGDRYLGHGHSTVSAGQTTLVAFKDLEPIALAEKKNGNSTVSRIRENRPAQNTVQKKASASSSKKSSSGFGKLKLNANVNNARLSVDGKILGAGNNTYSKIKSGRHKITVDKTGYTTYTEIVNIKKNKTTAVTARLDRLAEQAAPELTARDYLDLGNDALAENKIDLAMEDFNKAIAAEAGFSEGYIARGKLYATQNDAEKAVADYVRAGEIYRINKQTDKAIDAFSTALGYSPDNISAIVGRAGARADKGEYRSGLKDYEKALDIDKNFYPALYGAGVCQFKLGEHKKAEKYFRKAYETDNSDPYLYQYLMLTYLARDDIKKLRQIYAEFKVVANPAELAAFKSSSRFEPVLRLIKEEDR